LRTELVNQGNADEARLTGEQQELHQLRQLRRRHQFGRWVWAGLRGRYFPVFLALVLLSTLVVFPYVYYHFGLLAPLSGTAPVGLFDSATFALDSALLIDSPQAVAINHLGSVLRLVQSGLSVLTIAAVGGWVTSKFRF